MKSKLLSIAIIGLLLPSCKKIYTCECNTTVTYYSYSNKRFYTEVLPGSKTPYDKKLSNKQAKAACQHEETATQTNFTNWLTNNGAYSLIPGESVTTSCGLK
jgi:hypothetical protein